MGRSTLAALMAVVCLGTAPAAAETEVDVELCLAADGSGSITTDEFAFQRQGYATAIRDERVLGAIASGLTGRIALAHMEWGGAGSMHAIVEWTTIDGVASAQAFGDDLVAAPRLTTGWNSISNAIAFCQSWIETNGFEGLRKVIDVSGDAGQRGGVPLHVTRQRALDAGIVINALALNFRGGGRTGPAGQPLLLHYQRDVIGGPGAFALAVDSPDAFVDSLVRKLVLEIAGTGDDGETREPIALAEDADVGGPDAGS